ncbi:MAG: amidohydrolase [Sphingomonadales bacterium]
MRNILKAILTSTILLTLSFPSFAQSDFLKGVFDDRYPKTAELARDIWELAEVGYLETNSSKLMQDHLREEGFSIKAGVAGIPTAFVAEYGNGGPIIGIIGEMDALPGINQNSIPTRELIEGKGAGHACGHNLFAAGSVGAAIAVKKWLVETGTPGTIRLYGTPAEEGGSGKVYMVRAGLFDDVDLALHWHAGDRNSASANTTLSNRSAKFRFYGVSAHAANAPHNARSALDAVEAMNNMVNMMREHVEEKTRIHYVITAGGNAPNVVPDYAEAFYYLRHPSADKVIEMWPRIQAAAEGAAMGTGTTVETEIIHGNHAVVVNETLAREMHRNLTIVGGVNYTPAEQAFAEEIYPTLNSPTLEIPSASIVQPFTIGFTSGSTDVADVSIAVPTVGLRTATYVPGTSAHSWQAVAAAGMSIGFKGAHNASKTLAMTTIELFQNKALRDKARAEWVDKIGPDYVYKAVLGDRDPPLDYRINK